LEFIGLGMKRLEAFAIGGITRHQFYYKSSTNTRGVKPTSKSILLKEDAKLEVGNDIIIEIIKGIKSDPDLNYGYIKMTAELNARGYNINKKKVYRIMFQNNLLNAKPKVCNKKYVKYRQQIPPGPLALLAMDIKLVYIPELSKQAYILSIIDAFTRVVLYSTIRMSIKQDVVIEALSNVIEQHLQPNDCLNKGLTIEIRNDNDKRFTADAVRKYLDDNKLNQVFSHPYTPQDNGYIESFHNILSDHLNRNKYWSLEEYKRTLVCFINKYNNVRLHSSVGNKAPMAFWDKYEKNEVVVLCKVKSRQMKVVDINKIQHIMKHLPNKANQVIMSQSEESGIIKLSRRDAIENENRQTTLPIKDQEANQYKQSPSLESGNCKIEKKELILQ
jgi:putative transposase